MQCNYFDIHSHLNLEPLSSNREEIIGKMKGKGIGTITVGTDLETSRLAIAIAEENPGMCFATVGLHPNDNEAEVFDAEEYKNLASHPAVVAIGECGLDYFRSKDDAMIVRQKELFKQHITLALALKKPLMIHARPSKGSMDAYTDVLDILQHYPGIRANFHFFIGDIAIAQRALDMGFTMSFDGPITFSHDYDEVIKMLPLGSIMAETDAPFAAPAPFRGKTCEPWMVEEVVKRIAEIKEAPLEMVQKQLLENVKTVFDISPKV